MTICGIKWNYSVWCWGFIGVTGLNQNSQYDAVRFTPQLITTRPSISVERVHPNAGMCIRDRKQLLWCKLEGAYFSVSGWRLMSSAPVREASFVHDGQMCYLTTTNVMRCWGNNRHGVFPTGPGTPVQVKNPRSAAGAFRSLMGFSCALGVDGIRSAGEGRTHIRKRYPHGLQMLGSRKTGFLALVACAWLHRQRLKRSSGKIFGAISAGHY
jgi:hypothetical protein